MSAAKPCPLCGAEVEVGGNYLLHPEGECLFAGAEFGDWTKPLADSLAKWNARAEAFARNPDERPDPMAPHIRAVEALADGFQRRAKDSMDRAEQALADKGPSSIGARAYSDVAIMLTQTAMAYAAAAETMKGGPA